MSTVPDLSDCAREPIHIPGAVQPHGCLLAFDPGAMVVSQASANTETYLGIPHSQVLGASVLQWLPAPVCEALRLRLQESSAQDEPLRWIEGGREVVGLLHPGEGLAVLEVEPDVEDDRGNFARALARGIRRLSGADSLAALLGATADLVQELTSFERVLIYRFDQDDHGEVIAERIVPGLEPYLGLHYPESDIPSQARALYLRNWVRAIPDARYVPVPILPTLRPDSKTPLDLSDCGLRSVSPVHLEYLANMGIQASMSVSLVVGQRLWGLISCGQRNAHPIPHRLRSACESIGRLVSLQIAALETLQLQEAEAFKAPWMSELVETMHAADDEVLKALITRPEALLKLVSAAGAAAVTRDEVAVTGSCPQAEELHRLAEWAWSSMGGSGLFHSRAVPREAGIDTACAAGLLSIALPGPELRCLLWFRPEVVQTVNWGGNPDKPVRSQPGDDVPRLHPRRSFALWQETLKGQSLRWEEPECRAAAQLRRSALEVDLAMQVRKEQAAVRARDDLVAVVSHDLRTPMSVVVLQAAMIQRLIVSDGNEQSRRLRASAQMIHRAADRMSALLHDLLDLAKIEAGRYHVAPSEQDVGLIITDAFTLLEPLAQANKVRLVISPPPEIAVLADPERIFQVLANLIGNAIKFSPEGAEVSLGADRMDGWCEIWVRDQGPGIPAKQLPQLFNRYWQARSSDARGAGLGLYISQGIVRAHGGDMRVESVEGQGSVFRFTLPIAPFRRAGSR